MPEIKHQFTGGRMNKDLDERLIKNGEYKDAMNIQVSTSEDSDVGTVQNILGNSLVLGQNIIDDNSHCVGSIADEKNDKLYYFTCSKKDILPDIETFEFTPIIEVDYSGEGVFISTDGTASGSGDWPQFKSPGIDLEDGKTYRVEVNVADVYHKGSGKTNKFFVSGYSGGGGTTNYRPNMNMQYYTNSILKDGVYSYWFTFDKTLNNNSTSVRFHFELSRGNDHRKELRILNASLIEEPNNCIIEYNTKFNKITPVIVDKKSDILNFNYTRSITGINIIDDMLFWTDNHYEPKKINIPRCIKGTDPSGTSSTKLVNDSQDIDFSNNTKDLKEEHITVIKKSPKIAPTIELITGQDPTKTYAGVMRITSPGSFEGSSSMRTWNDFNYPYTIAPLGGPKDFSGFSIGQKFYTYIETDINGESGFTLDWKRGDTVVFKEFSIDDSGNQIAPRLPILDYTIKAKILTQGSIWQITDALEEFISGDVGDVELTQPSSNGLRPKALNITTNHNPGQGWQTADYDPAGSKYTLVANTSSGWAKCFVPDNPFNWEDGKSYKITVKISGYSFGKMKFIAVGPGSSSPYYWQSSHIINGDGEFYYDFTYNADGTNGNNTSDFSFYEKSIIMQADNTAGFSGSIDSISVKDLSPENARVPLEVISIQGTPPTVLPGETDLQYAIEKIDESEKLFEFKFPRFAYRYQYEDKEYSNISPFSSVAFSPGGFDYHPKKGYNLGMTNKLNEVKIKDFVKNVPHDVVAIDILYKDEVSPNIYVVDTIKPKLDTINSINIWNQDEYVITTESIKQVLPSNQILRPWDNVPRKALAQDIVGNRIVYGNYIQNYDLIKTEDYYYPEFNITTVGDINTTNRIVKSIKSLREYQLGVVFIDEHGRETPVITNQTAKIKLSKLESNKENKINIKLSQTGDNLPFDMKYFKFFIKETSGEYYNMAMDRWYEAEDEHIWLSFPSSDINKIDIETFLILKKGLESNDLIEETARYKVIDIQSEAPEYIKQNKLLIDTKIHDTSASGLIGVNDVFGDNADTAPLSGRDYFSMNYLPFSDSTSSKLHELKDGNLYIEFGSVTDDFISERYRIVSITTNLDTEATAPVSVNDAKYFIKLDRVLGEEVSNVTVDNNTSPNYVKNETTVNIYKYIVEESPQFDGRFFVKVAKDDTFVNNIQTNTLSTPEYRTVANRKLYFLGANQYDLHHNKVTGQVEGKYHDSSNLKVQYTPSGTSTWDSTSGYDYANPLCRFGAFAPFFRNYKHKPNDFTMWRPLNNSESYLFDDNISVNVGGWPPDFSVTLGEEEDAGQYAFGDTFADNRRDQPWKFELAYFTANPSNLTAVNDYNNGYLGWVYAVDPSDSTHATFHYFHYNGPDTRESAKFADDHGWNEAERDGTFNADGEQETGSVWFVDAGPYVGSRVGYDNLHWSWINQANRDQDGDVVYSPKYNGGITKSSSNNNGRLRFGVNLFDDEVNYHSDNSITDMFLFGVEGGNSNTDNYYNRNIVSKIYPSKKFKWKEDPAGKIYTFVSIDEQKLLRYSADRVPWPHATQYGQGSGDLGNSWTLTNLADFHLRTNAAPEDYNFGNITAQYSPNITKTWSCRYEDDDGYSDMAWDPSNGGNTGPIPNGIKISLTAAAVGTNPSGSKYQVTTNSIEAADDVTGITYQLTVGMILTSYNNGSVVLESGNTLTHDHSSTAAQDFDPLIVKGISESGGVHTIDFAGYVRPLTDTTSSDETGHFMKHKVFDTDIASGQTMVFQQPAMNGYSQYSVNRINQQDANNDGWSMADPGLLAVGYTIEFVEEILKEPEMPDNPAIWETEPKESTDLDIYYEASGYNPLNLTEDNKNIALPIGSKVKHIKSDGTYLDSSIPGAVSIKAVNLGTSNTGTTNFYSNDGNSSTDAEHGIYLSDKWHIHMQGEQYTWQGMTFSSDNPYVGGPYINPGDSLEITKPNGEIIIVKIIGYSGVSDGETGISAFIFIDDNFHSTDTSYTLGWHNCYSFGNGVESNRIRDSFNLPFIINGVKVSSILGEDYSEEHRKYGLIYSGLYNTNSGINNLNQFIAAEKITKDINPIYGSIQKLHTRDTDLVTLCEDKVLKILANKDAVFNADGNPNLTATPNVLGQTIPFIGEYGISKNPESFASEAYRAYFTDMVRGAVMRLSKDGLTPISEHGMKDWFKDNLKLSNKLIGSYDDKKDEYNITVAQDKILGKDLLLNVQDDDWILSGGAGTQWTINNGVFQGQDGHWGYATAIVPEIIEGKEYELSYTITASETDESGSFILANHGSGGNNINLNETLGIYKIKWTQGSANVGKISLWNNSIFDGTVENISVKEVTSNYKTVSFKENVKGWTSFKSFSPENAISCANDYYTLKSGKLWKHHDESVDRNTFYNVFTNSSVNTVLNDAPSTIKSYHTLSYEGSQAKIDLYKIDIDTGLSTAQTYNLSEKDGWYVSSIKTDKKEGGLLEFVEKEGKWFNYIKGTDLNVDTITDFGSFDIQGLGNVLRSNFEFNPADHDGLQLHTITIDGDVNSSLQAGDSMYYQSLTSVGGMSVLDHTSLSPLGQVVSINNNEITLSWPLSNEMVKDNQFNINQFPNINGDNWVTGNGWTIQDGKAISDSSIQTSDLYQQNTGTITGKVYKVVIDISEGDQGGLEVSVGDNDSLNNKSVRTNGISTFYLTADEDDGEIKISSMNYFNGVVNGISVKMVEVGSQPTDDDYCMFIKNQIVNMSGLLGYYANVKLENNSKTKAKLFSISSEITESSK